MRARTIYLIKRAEVASRSLLETELKDLDLTPSQYATLSMLSSHPDASSWRAESWSRRSRCPR